MIFLDKLPYNLAVSKGNRPGLFGIQNVQTGDPLKGDLEAAVPHFCDLVDLAEGADFASAHRHPPFTGFLPLKNQSDQIFVIFGFPENIEFDLIDVEREEHIRKGNHLLLNKQRQFFGDFDIVVRHMSFLLLGSLTEFFKNIGHVRIETIPYIRNTIKTSQRSSVTYGNIDNFNLGRYAGQLAVELSQEAHCDPTMDRGLGQPVEPEAES